MVKEYVQYLSHDMPLESAGNGAYLWSEDTRVMFNAFEGTQRYTSETRIRLTKTALFLLTRLSVWTFFGLPGILLTIDDAQVHTAKLAGPQGLSEWLRRVGAEFFQYRRMHITVDEVSEPARRRHRTTQEEEEEGGNKSSSSNSNAAGGVTGCTVQTQASSTSKPWTVISEGKLTVLAVALPQPAHAAGSSCAQENDDDDEQRVAYLCWFSVAPKIDIAKARAAGVAPGPKLALLKQGQSVPSDADPSLTVFPRDVMVEGSGAARGVLVLDVANPSCVDAGIKCVTAALHEWQQHQRHASSSAVAATAEEHVTTRAVTLDTVMHVSPCYHKDPQRYVAACEKSDSARAGHVYPSSRVSVVPRASLVASKPKGNKQHLEQQQKQLAWQSQEFVESVEPLHCCEDKDKKKHDDGSPSHDRTTSFQQARIHRLHLNVCCPDYFPLPSLDVNAAADNHNGDNNKGNLDGGCWHAPCHAVQYFLGGGSDEEKRPGTTTGSANGSNNRKMLVAVDHNVLAAPTTALAESMLSEHTREAMAKLKSGLSSQINEEKIKPVAAAVTFYGTGSAVPSKYRNVSSFHLTLPHDDDGDDSETTTRSVLFDCGEGTLGQMNSFCDFQHESFRTLVRGLRIISVSHMHADHHLGIHTLLRYWQQLQHDDLAASTGGGGAQQQEPSAAAPRLVVIGPSAFCRLAKFFFLFAPSSFSQRHASSSSVHFIDCDEDGEGEPSVAANEQNGEEGSGSIAAAAGVQATSLLSASRDTSDWRITCFVVDHPACAHGFRFTSAARAADVCFSGDTRPCANVVAAARDVALLIHEATFEDELSSEAIAKKHSTVSEAINVATACNAKSLLLTHFSQRYPKIPSPSACGGLSAVMGKNADQHQQQQQQPLSSSGVAMSPCFDFLHCPVDKVSALSRYIPVFQLLVEEYESWGEGTGKRYREQQCGATGKGK